MGRSDNSIELTYTKSNFNNNTGNLTFSFLASSNQIPASPKATKTDVVVKKERKKVKKEEADAEVKTEKGNTYSWCCFITNFYCS